MIYQSSDPLDPRNGLPLYNGPRDFQGLRNVSGDFNNLIRGQTTWGATNEQFLRLVQPDYSHYLQEQITLPPDTVFGPTVTVTGPATSVTSETTVSDTTSSGSQSVGGVTVATSNS